ncbi:MAG: aspartate-semialdehyde dehydrogenase [Acidobacteriota bacterium]
MKRWRVAILGATGAVGQRFVDLLREHPWFEISVLAASDQTAGKPYGEGCAWRMSRPMPDALLTKVVAACAPPLDCDLIFGALPSSVAGQVEDAFAAAGYPVITNSGNHRMDPDVPLVVPEINADHVAVLRTQKNAEKGGFIVANPNCSTIALAMALAPLHRAFGLKAVQVVTMQAISGAGYPGVPAADLVDNVVPYISQEEEKMETETQKILGSVSNGGFEPAKFPVSAQCNRVNVRDGHMEAVSVQLDRKTSLGEVIATLRSFQGEPQLLGLPTAPRHPIVVRNENNRPQPFLDRDAENGMATVVGRVRECKVLDYKFVLLGHNTVRGAAGGTILVAEYLAAKGILK